MKILVIDDSSIHLKAAKQTLVDHDVTICDNHDEAAKLLSIQYDDAQRKNLQEQYRKEGLGWNEAYDKACQETRKPYWDAVLSDLLMPAGSQAQGNQGFKYVGQEMPVGWSLVLKAAKNGAQYVAVVTDMNHHDHPASAMLDALNHHLFTIDGSRALFTNYVDRVGIRGTEGDCKECDGRAKLSRSDGSQYDCVYCDGSGKDFAEYGKDWGKILNQLVTDKMPR